MCSWLYVVVVVIVIVVVVVDVFNAVITSEESRKTAIHTHSPSLIGARDDCQRWSAVSTSQAVGRVPVDDCCCIWGRSWHCYR